MTLTTWGPALDAEIAYRQAEVRRSFPTRPSRRRTPRPGTPAVAAPDAPTAAPQAGATPVAAPAPVILHRRPEAERSIAQVGDQGDGARRTPLSGSEAWPAA